jgi:hypothetical protein
MEESHFSHEPNKSKEWHQPELPFNDPHPYGPKPHQLSPKEEFYSNVSKKKPKPDPATVEAILQEEEELWNQ